MSRKLATLIKDSRIPGKYKRVLEAYAAFANNDGTNIYASKEKIGKKAGSSPDTIYRNTPDLLACGILTVAAAHTCRIENCNKGATHFSGTWGRYSTVYNLHIEQLQNAETYLCAKQQKVNAAKCRKVGTADCGTTQALKETPAALGKDQDSSALTSGSEKASEQVLLATTSLASPAPLPASQVNQNLYESALTSEEQDQKQRQEPPQPSLPQNRQDMFELNHSEEVDAAINLLYDITPAVTDAMVKTQLPLCVKILEFFPYAGEYAGLSAKMVVEWNRAHRSGKYATKDDKKLYIRTAAQFLKALESPSAALMNDYNNHDFENCETCKLRGIIHCNKMIKELREEKAHREAEERHKKARLAEEARLAKLCPLCKERAPGEMSLGTFQGFQGTHAPLGKVSRQVCDQCYDERFETQQRMGQRVSEVLIARPGYLKAKQEKEAAALEAKRKAEAAAIAKRMEEAEVDVPMCLECGQVSGHSRTCPTRQPKTQEATA